MPYYNLVHDDLRLIVSFSPKCASSTLKNWFMNGLPHPQKEAGFKLGSCAIPTSKIGSYEDHAKVLFIRDPFRRLVSFYCKWVVLWPNRWDFADEEKAHSLQGSSFSEFLVTLNEIASNGGKFQHHLIHQTDDIAEIPYDAVLAVEQLDTALAAVSEMFGLDYTGRRLNGSPYDSSLTQVVCDLPPQELAQVGLPDYRYFYDANLVSLAADLYQDDIVFYRRYYESSVLFKV